MTNIDKNTYNTTDLVLSIMSRVADRISVNVSDNSVADRLYNICSDLEHWNDDEGFGTSDFNAYVKRAKIEFDIQ
jgi:hypothetical protein